MKAISNICPIVILMILSLTFSACKKDAISVKSEKVYSENLPALPGGWGSLSMSLTLRPDGTATLIEEGDMASEGKYKIKGQQLIFKTGSYPDDWKFTIISEQEIHSPSGKKLRLIH
ncbi:MAG: hypothetical protein EOO43_07400 [Flavobacterium sp.]|nr:MAG: hypothetical protein EOO43_07400 [Flavobacterium sp.]